LYPKINQMLYFQVASPDEEEARIEYKSRIADVTDDYILMEVPMNEKTGRMKRLYIGDELALYFMAEGGVKNYFNSYVLGHKEEVIRLVVIKKPEPESISKIQRRNFLRVGAELEIAVKLMEKLQFLAYTEDVSGGGISFRCDGNWPLKNDDKIACWITIPFRNGTIDHVWFKGEIVRVKHLETGKQLAMVKFTEIPERERQKLIRFCFERQFEFRKQ